MKINMYFSPQWKILLYDRLGQDLLSPIMNVKSLRDEGVTLHLLLVGQSERDPVPDVPAIYFCRPTDENLRRIAKDMEDGLYGSYHFNFISPISRQRLEDLAMSTIRANAVQQVRKKEPSLYVKVAPRTITILKYSSTNPV